jgi:hypothetical protein
MQYIGSSNYEDELRKENVKDMHRQKSSRSDPHWLVIVASRHPRQQHRLHYFFRNSMESEAWAEEQ